MLNFKSFSLILGTTATDKNKTVALMLRRLHVDYPIIEETPICRQTISPSLNDMTVLSKYSLNR